MSIATPTSERSAAEFSAKALQNERLTREEARAILSWPDEDLLELVAAAHRVRRAFFGNRVRLNYLVNLQSGLCAEDCSYCTQSKVSKAPIEKYKLMGAEEVLDLAKRAVASGAARLCLVASMRGPGEREMATIEDTVRLVKKNYPQLEICTSLGLLRSGQAERLADSGVDAYNHNLNTSERYYGKICSTHTHEDRVDTVEKAKSGGLSACSGALFGMGETDEDILDVAFRLAEMNVDSIPINFLIPVPGTPLAHHDDVTPVKALKILALFRFLNPRSELRIAGGRELHLRSLQSLGLTIANSIFVGDYLTTKGQEAQADRDMVRDLGYTIEGEDAAPTVPAPLSDSVKIVHRSDRQ